MRSHVLYLSSLLFAPEAQSFLLASPSKVLSKQNKNIVPSISNDSHTKGRVTPIFASSGSPLFPSNDAEEDWHSKTGVGELEKLKQREAQLARLLSSVRQEKLSTLRSRPLKIGVVGFGRFGQFIARTFSKHGSVVATSRSDYSNVARGMGVKYVPMSDPASFVAEEPDVIVFAVSIMSFESTVRDFAPFIRETTCRPLIVDVLSVMEHPRHILLDTMPEECDILCTHPMFGPDSGKNGWNGLTFVYERTRIDGVVLDPSYEKTFHQLCESDSEEDDELSVELGSRAVHNAHQDSEAHVEGMDRMERFLSIWEEEGCRMVALSCSRHDAYAANSQFITHLVGRVLGSLGLGQTPIDTRGFESVLELVENTNADSFDLFYGLYKYNENSSLTIKKLQVALDEVVQKLKLKEKNDWSSPPRFGVNGGFGHQEESGMAKQEAIVAEAKLLP